MILTNINYAPRLLRINRNRKPRRQRQLLQSGFWSLFLTAQTWHKTKNFREFLERLEFDCFKVRQWKWAKSPVIRSIQLSMRSAIVTRFKISLWRQRSTDQRFNGSERCVLNLCTFLSPPLQTNNVEWLSSAYFGEIRQVSIWNWLR